MNQRIQWNDRGFEHCPFEIGSIGKIIDKSRDLEVFNLMTQHLGQSMTYLDSPNTPKR